MLRVALRQARQRSARQMVLRWGGGGATPAGVLFVAWGFLHQNDAPPYFDAIVVALAAIVPTLFAVSLATLWMQCARRATRLTQTGIVLGLIASALGTVRNLEDVIWHLWHTYDPTTYYLTQLFHVWAPSMWVALLFTGLFMSGIRAAGERGVRRLSTLLLAMGVCGWAYFLTDSGSLFEARSVHVAFGLLFGLGWVVLGLLLWMGECGDLDG